MLGLVLINVLINLLSAAVHSAKLTLAHLLIGTLLWLALPLFAVWLFHSGKQAGRWILVGLFGLRAMVGVLGFAMVCLPPVTRQPELILTLTCLLPLIDMLFYLMATLWLLYSCDVRSIRRRTDSSGATAGSSSSAISAPCAANRR